MCEFPVEPVPPATASRLAGGATPAPRDARGAAILLHRVTKQYPEQSRPAVGGLSLEIPAGGLITLVGPPGCGKTTVLRMVNRMVEPSSGRVVVGDQDVAETDERGLRRGIGYMVRTGGLFPHMTVAANIGQVPRMLGWGRRRTAARVDELLELVHLDPAAVRRRHPAELSAGQHERAGMARALAAGPSVLLLDDPFGAVDTATRQGLQQDLLRIQRQLGTTVVCATGDLAEALTLGQRVAVLDRGAKLLRYDSAERVRAAIAGDDAAALSVPGDDLAALPVPGDDLAALPVLGGDAAGLPHSGNDAAEPAGSAPGPVVGAPSGTAGEEQWRA